MIRYTKWGVKLMSLWGTCCQAPMWCLSLSINFKVCHLEVGCTCCHALKMLFNKDLSLLSIQYNVITNKVIAIMYNNRNE